MPDPPIYILDCYALIAYLADEPAAVHIERRLASAHAGDIRLLLSVINLGEVLYIIERKGGLDRAQEILALIRQLPIEIQTAQEEAVLMAAHIKAHHAISYADAFVVALAEQTGGTILTSDPEFRSVQDIVNIEWLAS